MDFHLKRANTVAGLPGLRNRIRGTGAISLSPDSRLKAMGSFSAIKATPPFEYADLSSYVKTVYDQGSEDSCVAFAIAGMQSVFQQIKGSTIRFNADELYRALGGIGNSGISTPDALNWAKSTGLRDLATGNLYPVQDFGFADPSTDEGVTAIKAAVSAKCPCVLALLLPSDFNDQYGQSGKCAGSVTSGYHQVVVIGYDAESLTFLNSYGPTWGTNGTGTIAWSFLKEPAQSGSVYAYTVSDTAQPAASQFFLRAWTAPSPDAMSPPIEKKLPLLDKLKAWKWPTWLWCLLGGLALACIIVFLVTFWSQLFYQTSLRIWLVSLIGLTVLIGAQQAIFGPGPRTSDPTFVRYVIAFNSVIFIVLGLCVVVITCQNWGTPFLTAGASLLTGGFFGLLFGYPSGVAQQTGGKTDTKDTQAPRLSQNLLAESASTLGKLLTGFTLAKVRELYKFLKTLCHDLGPAFAISAGAQDPRHLIGSRVAAAILLYFFATGFLSGLLLPSYFLQGKFAAE